MLKILRNSAIGTFIFFASLEICLFFLDIPRDYQPHSDTTQFQTTLSDEIMYTNLRSASIDFVYDGNPRGYFRENNTVQHITNSGGTRGPEVTLKKPENTVRVVFLGDSITFGEGVYFEDTYPERFKVLAQVKNLYDGQAIEVVNFGIGGYNTSQELTLVKRFLKEGGELDYIVVGYNMNDADESIFTLGPEGQLIRTPSALEAKRNELRRHPNIFQISRILRIVRNWWVQDRITKETLAYYHELYSEDNSSWLATQQAFTDFSEFSRETNLPVTFVVFPRLFQLDKYPFRLERERIRTALEIRDLDSVFIYPYLQEYKGSELWVHPTDSHPNEIVHNIAAQALVERYQKQKQVYGKP